MKPNLPSSAKTGWVYDPAFQRHNADLGHPEQPARLEAILQHVKPDERPNLRSLEFGPATDDDLCRIHPLSHMRIVESARGSYLDPDTFVSEESPEIARLAAGGVIAAARAVWKGDVTNAFCAVRPPGHHALEQRAMGFCLYNNIAVAAAAIQRESRDAKILIVDWDAHHGNGTQAIFYDDPDVLYTSVHQYPFYPGTGAEGETGRGDGKGFTVNLPMRAGCGNDEFLDGIDKILESHAQPYHPDLVLISAGFDAHRSDPLAMLNVSTKGFIEATRRVCRFADSECNGRIVSVLEGGYDLNALAASVLGHIEELESAAKTRGEGAGS